MLTKISIFSLSLFMIIFVSCDFSKKNESESEFAKLANNLRYDLTTSPEATDPNDPPGDENNDVIVKGKSQCNKSCFHTIPQPYNDCIDDFIKCKENNSKQCGKIYTQCLRDTDVIGKDWDEFKDCKMDCRNKVKECKKKSNECKNGCNASDGSDNEICINGCKEEYKTCIKDKVCKEYSLLCNETEEPEGPEGSTGSTGQEGPYEPAEPQQ